jgi:hypothetical protein
MAPADSTGVPITVVGVVDAVTPSMILEGPTAPLTDGEVPLAGMAADTGEALLIEVVVMFALITPAAAVEEDMSLLETSGAPWSPVTTDASVFNWLALRRPETLDPAVLV